MSNRKPNKTSTPVQGDSPVTWIVFTVILVLTLGISTVSLVQAASGGQFWSTLAIVALAVLVTSGLFVVTLAQRIQYKRTHRKR